MTRKIKKTEKADQEKPKDDTTIPTEMLPINKVTINRWLLVAMVMGSLMSCDPQVIFENYVTVPEGGWHKDSMATFNVTIDNVQDYHDLFVNIRNKSDYPNSNLWLFLDVTSPSGQTVRDTINCILSDERGKWLGSGWGSLFLMEHPYKLNVRFAEPGEYRFNIIQGMRYNDLKGIYNIGITIKKSKNQQ